MKKVYIITKTEKEYAIDERFSDSKKLLFNLRCLVYENKSEAITAFIRLYESMVNDCEPIMVGSSIEMNIADDTNKTINGCWTIDRTYGVTMVKATCTLQEGELQ